MVLQENAPKCFCDPFPTINKKNFHWICHIQKRLFSLFSVELANLDKFWKKTSMTRRLAWCLSVCCLCFFFVVRLSYWWHEWHHINHGKTLALNLSVAFRVIYQHASLDGKELFFIYKGLFWFFFKSDAHMSFMFHMISKNCRQINWKSALRGCLWCFGNGYGFFGDFRVSFRWNES